MHAHIPKRKRPPITKLINKINSLNQHQKEDFANQCNTTVGNLQQIAYGFGSCSLKLASAICNNCENLELNDFLTKD